MKSETKHLSPNMKPLGLLGGGQLARMMAIACHEMGVPVTVVSEKKTDPAAQVVSDWVEGSPSDPKILSAFLEKCSVVTFESEFLDAKLLDELSSNPGRAAIYPSTRVMASLQDRLSQKSMLTTAKLPTSPFTEITDEASARAALSEVGGLTKQVVFKARRFGYDGYGTWVVKSDADFEKFKAALDADRSGKRIGFIAEKFVPFSRELALIVVRSSSGSYTRLPFVETFQENSRCLWVKGPVNETAAMKAFAKDARAFVEAHDYVGALAFELFETKAGELLVNELAPRVHNSGHYSLDAMSQDQFTLHVRAVLGLDLAPTESKSKGFAMVNLLGSHDREPRWSDNGDVRLHWYGKKENRPGRKMGHLNALDNTPEDALKKVLERRKSFDV